MLKKVNIKDVDVERKTYVFLDLKQFQDSGEEIAEIVVQENKKPGSYTSVYCNAIKRYQFKGIRAIMRNGRVFLIRTKEEY